MTSLEAKRVLVVGGSSGIGLAVARQALGEGALVTIASRSAEKLQAATAELGGRTSQQILDCTVADEVAAFLDKVSWDHVVVSAAETAIGSVRALPLDSARQAMDSKFWGAYHIARSAEITAGGSLTLVSGAWSVRPSADAVLQAAINAALEGLARGLALELSPVRVNAVSPGLIDTPLWSTMDAVARSAMFEAVAAGLPAKTIGTADDVAGAILYLMRTAFATGTTLRIDGGGAIA